MVCQVWDLHSIFGTDVCSLKNSHKLAEHLRNAMEAKHISAQVFEKIAWQNANRILNLNLA